MVVKNFSDPAFHSAYLAQAATARTLNRAGQRYREHQAVMAALPDERWQAELADIMLTRVENLANLWMEKEAAGIRLPWAWRVLMPNTGFWRIAWIVVGMILATKIIRLVPV